MHVNLFYFALRTINCPLSVDKMDSTGNIYGNWKFNFGEFSVADLINDIVVHRGFDLLERKNIFKKKNVISANHLSWSH